MSRNRTERIFLIVIAALIFTGIPVYSDPQDLSLLITQVQPPTNGNRRIEIIASVIDGAEKPVKGLTEANFDVEISTGHLSGFSVQPVDDTDEGIAILLAIDVSGSMKGKAIKEAKAAAISFVDGVDPNDIVAVMTFGSTTKLIADFTSDRGRISEAIESIAATDPLTYLWQAFYDATAKAGTAPLARRVVVILTDGKDEGSPITLDDAIGSAEKYGVPVYALAFGKDIEHRDLRRITTLSNGRYLYAPDVNNVRVLYATALDQLKNQYLLTVPVNSLTAGEHTLTVTLNYLGMKYEATGEFISAAIPEMDEPSFVAAKPIEDGASAGDQQTEPAQGMNLIIQIAIGIVGIVIIVLILGALSKGKKQKCQWCGEALKSDEEGYCEKCVDHAGDASEEGQLPPQPDAPVSPESLVWLDIKSGPEKIPVGKRIWLGEEPVNLGRGPKNDIDLRDDEISREHARISRDPKGHYVVEDIGSQNRIFVNGDETTRHTLRNGDNIRVGKTMLIFSDHRDK